MSAVALITKAIELDVSGRRIEALKLYEDGIAELLKICKAEQNEEKKKHFQAKIIEYMNRAEQVKRLVQTWSTKGELKDKILIIDGATGYSYRRIFEKYLTPDVKEMIVQEPYLKEHYQLCNLVMLCELAVSKCPNLKFISVTSTAESKSNEGFKSMTEALKKRGIQIVFDFIPNLHDRQVILSNGYIIKIGRGLHYFKPLATKYSLGMYDFDFRECRETNVDIFYCPENKK